MAIEENLRHDLLVELWVTLHSNVLSGDIHGLHGANLICAKGYCIGGKLVDNVLMHLVDALPADVSCLGVLRDAN